MQEGGLAMIELTRFNGSPMVLNSDLIKTAEASPDTMLTLINGEKLIVREEPGEVVERVAGLSSAPAGDRGAAHCRQVRRSGAQSHRWPASMSPDRSRSRRVRRRSNCLAAIADG